MMRVRAATTRERADVLEVLLADDDSLVRQAVADTLAAEPDMTVVGSVADGEAAYALAQRLRPHVLVLDVRMPGGGVPLVRRMVEDLPEVRLLALSGESDPTVVLALLAAGAGGFAAKLAGGLDLAGCIRRCARGELFVTGPAASGVRRALARLAPPG